MAVLNVVAAVVLLPKATWQPTALLKVMPKVAAGLCWDEQLLLVQYTNYGGWIETIHLSLILSYMELLAHFDMGTNRSPGTRTDPHTGALRRGSIPLT